MRDFLNAAFCNFSKVDEPSIFLRPTIYNLRVTIHKFSVRIFFRKGSKSENRNFCKVIVFNFFKKIFIATYQFNFFKTATGTL